MLYAIVLGFVIEIALANRAEAIAGTSNTKVMTPLRTQEFLTSKHAESDDVECFYAIDLEIQNPLDKERLHTKLVDLSDEKWMSPRRVHETINHRLIPIPWATHYDVETTSVDNHWSLMTPHSTKQDSLLPR